MTGLIDLTGARFGKLLVTKRAENTKDRQPRARWECQCDCGNTKTIRSSSLINGTTKSCGCLTRSRKYNLVDLSGLRFGKWIVIKKGEKKSGGTTYWLCRCDCGKEKEVQRTSLIRGQSTQCTECSDKPIYIGKMYRHYYKITKQRAEKRNIEFDITPEYLGNLLEKQNYKCVLSGLPLDFHSTKNYSGTASLDRIDSSKGYVIGNLQWVHRSVNFMKGSLPQSDFIAICRLIAKQQKGKNIQFDDKALFWMPSHNGKGRTIK